MQKIFSSGQIYTLNASNFIAEAIFVNDENIVFTGLDQEVLTINNGQATNNNLDKKVVLPSFYDTELDLNKIILPKLKSAKKQESSGKLMLNKPDIAKDCSYTEFKTAFLNFQKQYIENGVTNVWINNITENQFKYLKMLSEKELLKIDFTAYVDFVENKNLMDENCRSYRKYKNHFRIGGYMISLDGKISQGKAWLNKPYKHSGKNFGCNNIVDEGLEFVIKTAINEKKQLVASAHGDRAVDQFLRCYNNAIKQIDDTSDNYKILLKTSGLISDKQLSKLKENGIGLMLDLSEIIYDFDLIKGLVGKKLVKQALNLSRYFSRNDNILIPILNNNFAYTAGLLFCKLQQKSNALKYLITKNIPKQNILKSLISAPAYYSFEIEQKGSLEVGKKANFVVFENQENFTDALNLKILEVYNSGNKVL